jgi:hypothetical protein
MFLKVSLPISVLLETGESVDGLTIYGESW